MFVDTMDSDYYTRQALGGGYNYSASGGGAYFASGQRRQHGAGLGSFIAGIGRVAIPLVKRYIIPTAKAVGKEFVRQAAPGMMDAVVSSSVSGSSPSKARIKGVLKNAARKTAIKQMAGGGPARRRRAGGRGGSVKKKKKKPTTKRRSSGIKGAAKRKKPILKNNLAKRSRKDFFSSVSIDQ